jgi:hypothetical protein
MIAAQRNATTYHADIEALNHAGFIRVLSREELDEALEKFYASRARPRARKKEEEEKEKEPRAVSEGPLVGQPDSNSPGISIDQITPNLRSVA